MRSSVRRARRLARRWQRSQDPKQLTLWDYRERRANKLELARLSRKYPDADPFYVSEAWRRVRYVALRASNGRCNCCGRAPPDVVLHVDHIKPRSRFPALALNVHNLQVLCDACNLGKGASDTRDWRSR